MEPIGSRFGRVSSRYGSITGPGPSVPAFNGPVRKWKRKWVHSSQPNDLPVAGKGNHRYQENKPTLLLCRWTRLPAANNSDDPPEPATKRKFRYTPVVVLEEKKKDAVRKINAEAEAMEMKKSGPQTIKDDLLTYKPEDYDFTEGMEEASEAQAIFKNLDLHCDLMKPYQPEHTGGAT